MKCVIVGLGSMGKRRIRLIKQKFSDVEICGIDTNKSRRDECNEKFNIIVFDNIDIALKNFKANSVFVCTSPLSHSDIISQCLQYNLHVFTELNLINDKYEENIELAKQKGKVLFLSSTFLYRDEIIFICNRVHEEKRQMTYTYHVGQYLPDWHPWESFNDFFVAESRTNGCRELFAVELPWLIECFGKAEIVNAKSVSVTSLVLPYPDSYIVTLQHQNGTIGQMLIDVATRIPVRHLEVFGESIQLEWRGTPDTLFCADEQCQELNKISIPPRQHIDGYRPFIIEDAYTSEIEAFFRAIKNGKKPIYNFESDGYVLNLIDQIEGLNSK